MTFRLQLLGGASIESDAGPLVGAVAQRRRLALLAMLAASPSGAMSRERMATLLFPEADSARAHKGLADALHAIRKALGKDAVLAVGDELRLDRGIVTSDVAELRAALAAREAELAATLYRGPFLDGFAVPDAAELEQWIETERGRIAGEFGRGLMAAAESLEAVEDFGGAAAWWQRLAAHDPYSSQVALRLMQALAASGNPAAAVRHAGVHAALLRDQLGVAPSSEVIALVERLRCEASTRTQPASSDTEEGRGTAHSLTFRANGAPPARIPMSAVSRGDATGAALDGAARDRRPSALPSAGSRVSAFRHDAAASRAANPREAGGLRPSSGTWRRTARVGLPLALAALVLAAVVRGFLPDLTTSGSPPSTAAALSARDHVVVADFESKGSGADLADVVTDALRIDLRQSAAFQVMESGQVRQALERMTSPQARMTADVAREVAIREGAKAVVAGSVAHVGTGHLVSVRLIAAQSGAELVALRETAVDSADLIPAIERLSRRLRVEIGEPLKAVRASAPLAAVTTWSLAALRKLSQADRAAFVDGDHERAIMLLGEAIALDSAFAAAHALLVSVLHMRSVLGGEAAMMRRAEALATAYRHRDRLTERERYIIDAAYHSQTRGEPHRAVAIMRAAAEARPDDAMMAGLLGYYLADVREFARAESLFVRAAELDPSGPSMAVLNNIALMQTHLAKFDEAEATWRRLAERYPTQYAVIANGVSLTAIARGDYDRAAQWLRDQREARPRDVALQNMATRRLAALAALRGQLADAERYWTEALHGEVPATAAMRLEADIALARHDMLLRGSPGRAVRRLDRALARSTLDAMPVLDRPYLALASVYAQAGRLERAKSLVAAFERDVPWELRHGRNASEGVRLEDVAAGMIALDEGKIGQAVDHFHRADRGNVGSAVLPLLGLAFERARQPDSAIVVYERYLLPDMRAWISVDVGWLAVSHRRLANLYGRRGDTARAAAHYRRFIVLWENADAELQPQVRDARQRLRDLGVTEWATQH